MRRITDIDFEIGGKVRTRRIHLGLSQQELGDAIGVTYQQFHKYERGINRVSAATLVKIARALGILPTDLLPGSPLPRTIGPRERLTLEHARHFALLEPHEQAAVSALTRGLLDKHENVVKAA